MERARVAESAPKGWPAALVMFHFGMWRERIRNSLAELADGRTPTPPPPLEQQNEINDKDLARGIGTPLNDAAARSDHLLSEIIELYGKLGDQPFEWYRWKGTTEAVLANSYTHPRIHMYDYLRENGEHERANRLFEDALQEVKEASSSPAVHAIALYNLACVRSYQGRTDVAITVLGEAIQLRPAMKAEAAGDKDLNGLRDDPRFQELVKA